MKKLLVLLILVGAAWFGYQKLSQNGGLDFAGLNLSNLEVPGLEKRSTAWVSSLVSDMNSSVTGAIQQGGGEGRRLINECALSLRNSKALQSIPEARAALGRYLAVLETSAKSLEEYATRLDRLDSEKQAYTDTRPRGAWLQDRKERIFLQWETTSAQLTRQLQNAATQFLSALPKDLIVEGEDTLVTLKNDLKGKLQAGTNP